MYRHQLRALVELGRFESFLAAATTFNAVAARLELPVYRLWVTVFGDLNEVWAETDFESLDEHWRRFRAAHEDPSFQGAFVELCSHFVPGSAHDSVSELVPL
jgi:hypothetical protein